MRIGILKRDENIKTSRKFWKASLSESFNNSILKPTANKILVKIQIIMANKLDDSFVLYVKVLCISKCMYKKKLFSISNHLF